MIKVLLVIPTLDRSGAEKQFALLATHLPRDEFEVHTVALTRGGPYEAVLRERGIPLTVLNKRWRLDPRALWDLRQLIFQLQPDILHTWLFAANAYGRQAAGRNGAPAVIVSERCVDSWKSGWQLTLDRRQRARTTRLIGNSQGVADFYQEQGFAGDRIVVIPNGTSIPERIPFDRDAVLAEFDIPPGSQVVGSVGRLARQKRGHDLIWAMQLLRQLRDRVYYLIVGDGPEKVELIKLAEHMGCDHLVRFAGHREDAEQLMATMNVLWLGSDFEGMSNSVMEAMAAGLPVIATDIPPNRELVVDGETGYLVRVGDSVGFAQFSDRILADQELAQRLGAAGRERIRKQFSIVRMVDAHADLYRRVVAEQAESTTGDSA